MPLCTVGVAPFSPSVVTEILGAGFVGDGDGRTEVVTVEGLVAPHPGSAVDAAWGRQSRLGCAPVQEVRETTY